MIPLVKIEKLMYNSFDKKYSGNTEQFGIGLAHWNNGWRHGE